MSWNTRDKEIHPLVGPAFIGQVLTSKQNCSECNAELVDPFKSDPRDADTWFWTECDECNEPVCESCSDSNDETGERFCITCLGGPTARARLEAV